MPYVISLEAISETMELVEKRLFACGLDRAVSILRHALAEGQDVQFVEDFAPSTKLSLLNYDGSIMETKRVKTPA
jgi:hypothetical protein